MAVGSGMSQIVVFANDHVPLRSIWALWTVCSLLRAHIAQTDTNCWTLIRHQRVRTYSLTAEISPSPSYNVARTSEPAGRTHQGQHTIVWCSLPPSLSQMNSDWEVRWRACTPIPTRQPCRIHFLAIVILRKGNIIFKSLFPCPVRFFQCVVHCVWWCAVSYKLHIPLSRCHCLKIQRVRLK